MLIFTFCTRNLKENASLKEIIFLINTQCQELFVHLRDYNKTHLINANEYQK